MQGSTTQCAAEFVPHDEKAEQILRKRAELLAKQETEKIDKLDGITYVRFRLGPHEIYGMPYNYIKEIMGVVQLTKLPSVADFVGGIINRRGALLAVLDLKKFFNFTSTEYEKDSYILVVKSGGITIGILADGIEGSDIYDPSTLDAPLPSLDAIKPEYLLGLHKGVTSIINIEAIMSDSRFLQMMK